MTDFTVDSSATGGIDTRWRASKHGQANGIPGTLDISAFVSGTHYNIPGNRYGADIIPSGVAVAKAASGLFVPFDPAAGSEGDPRRTFAGYINDDEGIPVKRASGATSAKSSFSLLKHGIIDAALLPVSAQRTQVKTATTTGNFTYLD